MLLITVGRLREGGMTALAQYAEGALPLIIAAGREVVARGRLQETAGGHDKGRPDLVAMIRFPDADAIRRFLGSAAYQAHVRYRDAAFADLHSYIATDLIGEVSS